MGLRHLALVVNPRLGLRQGACWSSKMGLGRMTSVQSRTWICRNQRTSWLMHSLGTFGARTSHGQTMGDLMWQPSYNIIDEESHPTCSNKTHRCATSLCSKMSGKWQSYVWILFNRGCGECEGSFPHTLLHSWVLEILFDSNPQSWWMGLTFIKRMNNIYIFIVVRLGWIMVVRVWKWRLLRAWWWLGLRFGGG